MGMTAVARSNDRISERASIALQILAERDPAFSSLSLWVHHRDSDEEFAPAWTNGKSVWYGPGFAKFSQEEQVGVCAHEILHVAFRHIPRAKRLRERLGGKFSPYLMNIATDAIINETLLQAGYKLPRPCVVLTELLKEVFDETIAPRDAIAEWDAEKLYLRIINHIKQQMQRSGGGADGGSKSGAGDQGQDGGAGKGRNQGQGRGSGAEDMSEGERIAREYAASKGFGDDMDVSGAASGEDPTEDAEWAARVARARSAAGVGQGILGQKIADLPQVRTPWEVILRTRINRAITREPRVSMLRPARRWLGMDSDAMRAGRATPAYEPGVLKENDKPRVVVCVDTSGSIWSCPELLNRFAAEIASIGRRTGAEIHIVVFDHGIQMETKMQNGSWEAEITKIEFKGGGGTSFIEPVNRAAELKASIIVVLTDLMGPFGEAPGKIPVIWAIPDDAPPQGYTPPFGTVVSMSH